MVGKGWLSRADRTGLKFPAPKETSGADTGMSGQRGYLVTAIKDYLRTTKIATPEELEAAWATASPPPWTRRSRTPSSTPSTTN